MTTLLSAPEQTRARHPDEEGYAERDLEGAGHAPRDATRSR
jgi:hypothetical protein